MKRNAVLRGEVWRFLLGGLVNTAFFYGVYYLLNLAIHYQPAYAIAYVAGVFFSYWLNSRWVFHTAMSWKSFLAFPLVYVVQYGVGAALMYVLVARLGLSESLAPVLVIAANVPLSFVMTRLVLKR
jgi:putative flippase GtrA